jgi:hypothetical protein
MLCNDSDRAFPYQQISTMGVPMPTRRHIVTAGLAAGVLPAVAWAQQGTELQWLSDVLSGSSTDADAALASIHGGKRLDMTAGLILALRFVPEREAGITATLRDLTGERGAKDWFAWMLWQEKHPEVIAHASFIPFMRDLYLRIDPAFDAFLRPEYLGRDRALIRPEEITWGGVVKDGIPALDNPPLIAASEASYLRADDLVFGVAINGDIRAYPLRIMGWHEMFNEVIGGVPVALAYCTLCGSGILYETKVKGRAKPLIFGSSGFLYRSNKLMFDRATLTLWNQFTGLPVEGKLVGSGIALQQRPVVIARWDDWMEANPTTRVLALETGYQRDYGSGVVYSSYFASRDLMFPAVVDQSRQKQKDYVFGIRRFGGAKAWPLTAFRRNPVINDAVADFPVVLLGDAETRSARAYERGDLRFAMKSGKLTSSDGAVWQTGEEALVAADGRVLPRVAGHVAYWFAWDGYLGDAAELYPE